VFRVAAKVLPQVVQRALPPAVTKAGTATPWARAASVVPGPLGLERRGQVFDTRDALGAIGDIFSGSHGRHLRRGGRSTPVEPDNWRNSRRTQFPCYSLGFSLVSRVSLGLTLAATRTRLVTLSHLQLPGPGRGRGRSSRENLARAEGGPPRAPFPQAASEALYRPDLQFAAEVEVPVEVADDRIHEG
jgi:hypothetical protein